MFFFLLPVSAIWSNTKTVTAPNHWDSFVAIRSNETTNQRQKCTASYLEQDIGIVSKQWVKALHLHSFWSAWGHLCYIFCIPIGGTLCWSRSFQSTPSLQRQCPSADIHSASLIPISAEFSSHPGIQSMTPIPHAYVTFAELSCDNMFILNGRKQNVWFTGMKFSECTPKPQINKKLKLQSSWQH